MFDDPREVDKALRSIGCVDVDYTERAFDWAYELKRRIRVRGIVRNLAKFHQADVDMSIDTLLRVLKTAAPPRLGPAGAAKACRRSANVDFVNDLLQGTARDTLLRRERLPQYYLRSGAGTSHGQPELFRHALLNIMCGLQEPAPGDERQAAQALVYDLRNYRRQTLWGPYLPDGSGRADWRRLEAIFIVTVSNALEFRQDLMRENLWTEAPFPLGLHYSRALSAPGALNVSAPEHEGDWAGVSGEWRRMVCFCDYRDLFRFNFNVRRLPTEPYVTQLKMFEQISTRGLEHPPSFFCFRSFLRRSCSTINLVITCDKSRTFF